MLNLSKRTQMPIYPDIHSNVDGFFGVESLFYRTAVPALVTKRAKRELEELYNLYIKQTKPYHRWLYSFFLRMPYFWRLRENSLEKSRLMSTYCNGFAVAYNYFFYEKTCFMTSLKAVKDQVNAYLKSSRVPSLSYKPDDTTESIDSFVSYAFDLGQKVATEFVVAIFEKMDKHYSECNDINDYLKLRSDSDLPSDFVHTFVKKSIEYLEDDKKGVARRLATVVLYIQKSEVFLVKDSAKDLRDKHVVDTLITLFINSLNSEYRQKALFPNTKKYLNPNESRSIKYHDEQAFIHYLNDV